MTNKIPIMGKFFPKTTITPEIISRLPEEINVIDENSEIFIFSAYITYEVFELLVNILNDSPKITSLVFENVFLINYLDNTALDNPANFNKQFKNLIKFNRYLKDLSFKQFADNSNTDISKFISEEIKLHLNENFILRDVHFSSLSYGSNDIIRLDFSESYNLKKFLAEYNINRNPVLSDIKFIKQFEALSLTAKENLVFELHKLSKYSQSSSKNILDNINQYIAGNFLYYSKICMPGQKNDDVCINKGGSIIVLKKESQEIKVPLTILPEEIQGSIFQYIKLTDISHPIPETVAALAGDVTEQL